MPSFGPISLDPISVVPGGATPPPDSGSLGRTVIVPFVSRVLLGDAVDREQTVPNAPRILAIVALTRTDIAAPFPSRSAAVLAASRMIVLLKAARAQPSPQ